MIVIFSAFFFSFIFIYLFLLVVFAQTFSFSLTQRQLGKKLLIFVKMRVTFSPNKKNFTHCLKICSFYYQFLYYQELVEQLSLYYGSAKVGNGVMDFKEITTTATTNSPNLAEARNRYQLNKKSVPMTISTPKHITFLRLLYGLFFVRGAIIVFFKAATDSRQKRILLGCEHWNAIAPLMESTVFFW